MSHPRIEIGDIIERYGADYLEAFGEVTSLSQRHVLQRLEACRTPALGGRVYECDTCHQPVFSYNSCRDRHCPTCRGAAAAKWLADRQRELLPIPYFHVVFTLPHELGPLALQNKSLVYRLLFEAVSDTLLTIAADPKHLGARIGFLAILHTWGQALEYHPHLHCVVPGGGVAPDGTRWISSRPRFLLPVKVLSRRFRRTFGRLLRSAFKQGQLVFSGTLAPLADPVRFRALLDSIYAKKWVVYAKPPFGGPDHVLKYLARYTHRVAISNHRLISMDDGKVTFRWKDYADSDRRKLMTLEATEFLRRFLLHVLPKRFMRIRSYGLLANRNRKANIDRCRRLLDQSPSRQQVSSSPESPSPATESTDTEPTQRPCPFCSTGRLIYLRELSPLESLPEIHTRPRSNSS